MRKVSIVLLLSLILVNCWSQEAYQQRIDSLRTVLQSTKEISNRIDVYIQISNCYQNDTYRAIEVLYDAKEELDESNHHLLIARVFNQLGRKYNELYDFEQALDYYMQALTILKDENVGDSYKIAMTMMNIGSVFVNTSEFEKSIEYFEGAIKINDDQDTSLALMIEHNLANAYAKMGEYDKSISLHKKHFKNNLVPLNIKIMIPYSIGAIYHFQEKLDSSLYYYQLAYNYYKKIDVYEYMPDVCFRLGSLFNTLGNRKEALQFYNECVKYANLEKDKTFLIGAYREKSKIQASQGNYDSAYNLILKVVELNQEVEIQKTEARIKAIESKYDFLKRKELKRIEIEKELAIAEEEKKRQQLTNYILFVSSGGIIVLAILVIYLLRQKQKLTKSKLSISELQKQNLENDLELKSKELTAFTLRVTQNNQFLNKIDDIIQNLTKDPKEDVLGNLQNLKNEIRLNRNTQKDQDEFQKQFEGVHKDFLKNIKRKYPDLSTKELRLCAMMKMNLSTNEISNLMGVSMNSVKKSKYRIHKKMNLPEGERLAEYVVQLD